jgi:hypothetical protein
MQTSQNQLKFMSVDRSGTLKQVKVHTLLFFGVLKKGWTLKAPFIHGYLGTLVERMNSRKNTSINVDHCKTYYEFNINKVEYGNESLWLHLPPKNGKSGNTVKTLNFVLSFDVRDSAQSLEMAKDAIEFLAFTMKKRVQLVVSCWIILNITQLVSTDT